MTGADDRGSSDRARPTLPRQLMDPWGLLLAGAATWVAFAIHLPTWLVVLVGLSVWIGRVVLLWLLADDGAAHEAAPRPPDVEPGSDEALWLDRAIDAEAAVDAVLADLPDGPLTPVLDGLRTGIDQTVTGLYHLAEDTTAIRRALAQDTEDTEDDLAEVHDDLIARLGTATTGLEVVADELGALAPEAFAEPGQALADVVTVLAVRVADVRAVVLEAFVPEQQAHPVAG